ncbi:MAG: hypothetical protein JO170_00020 [Verrucomicrobia bacterium]|nr:hypothetical protein [Verrucomicrobiota bacterium]
MQSLQSQLKVLEASATSPLALVPLARQLLELARKSAGLPLPELQASLMLLASDALSKFDGSAAPASPPPAQQQSPPAHQPPVAEAHPTPPTPSPAPTETASVPSQPPAAAVRAPVVPVAEPQAVKTPPEGDSTAQTKQEEAARQEAPAATNLNSAKAEAKLVKALDYLVAINDNSDNPAQKWVINESILASLTGCFRPAIKKFFETHRSFINQANNTQGLGPGHNRGKARTNPEAIPELVKNFKSDALNQPF